jgi:folate-binding protein YgfZ
MTTCYILRQRRILSLSGPERATLLQGLITNDVARATPGNGVFAALLTPQGKILFDFILANEGDELLIDCEADRAGDLMRRLLMYRLRAKVEIGLREGWGVAVLMDGEAQPPEGSVAFTDPRSPELGLRILASEAVLDAWAHKHGFTPADDAAYAARRITLGIPEGAAEFGSDATLALEGNLDLLGGVDFKKGCYVGQELTARTHYRGKVRYRLFPVTLDGEAAPGSTVTAGDKKIGTLVSRVNGSGIAKLRQEDLEAGPLAADGTRITAHPLPGAKP